MTTLLLTALLSLDVPPAPDASTTRALWLADLDPDRLAVLADALEEAGCDNADILSHLRGPGPHVRDAGWSTCCWGRSNPLLRP